MSSYPTYEEWKQFSFHISRKCPFIVLILPMRNGNSLKELKDLAESKNSSYPTYEEWKQKLIKEYEEKKKGSYPTYEEWKQEKR